MIGGQVISESFTSTPQHLGTEMLRILVKGFTDTVKAGVAYARERTTFDGEGDEARSWMAMVSGPPPVNQRKFIS